MENINNENHMNNNVTSNEDGNIWVDILKFLGILGLGGLGGHVITRWIDDHKYKKAIEGAYKNGFADASKIDSAKFLELSKTYSKDKERFQQNAAERDEFIAELIKIIECYQNKENKANKTLNT